MAPNHATEPSPNITEVQAAILDKFATIQAEMECLVRQTRRTLDAVKRTRGGND